NPQPAVFAAHLRLLQISETALGVAGPSHVPSALLREHLLGEHSLQGTELNVNLHRMGGRRHGKRKHGRTDHSCFSRSRLIVPIVKVIRTRICTGMRRRSSEIQTFRWAGRLYNTLLNRYTSYRIVLNVPMGVLTSSRCCASTFAITLFLPSLT